MFLHSIRWQLQIWYGLLLTVVLAAFGLTAYNVALEEQRRRTDLELEQQLRGPFPLLRVERWGGPPGPPPEPPPLRRPGGPGPGPFGPMFGEFRERAVQMIRGTGPFRAAGTRDYYFMVWEGDGSLLASTPGAPEAPVPRNETGGGRMERPPQLAPPGAAKGRTRGTLREVYLQLPGDECLLAGRSIEPEIQEMRRLALWFTLAGAAVLVIGLAGGWWVASRAIAPIRAMSGAALKIAAGDLSQRISIDKTDNELGQLAVVLNSTFARLETAFAEQVQFTSDASHELRTPVSVILTQTQTALSRSRAEPEYREALEACRRAAQRMRRLIESLLELARLDSGQEPMKRERFDLSRVARESVELVKPLADAQKVQILCDLPETSCTGAPEHIGRVVTNLVANAVQFTPEGGQVRVAAKAEAGAATLVVADRGEGIPAHALPHIFERFYRADESRSRAKGRGGLGLAICKAIVDAHCGTIEVQSEPGRGSTFTVKLPAGA